MPMAESQIKVSSIMFTDIVGYSRMVARDESHALKLLDEHNTLISKSIDVLDVIALVDNILSAGEYNPAGDLTGDGSLDVLDIVALVSIILEG